jgi:histidinol-phosphate aminotransferase
MAPYSPPTAGRADKLRLDFNENTVGCSPRVLDFLRERLSEDGLSVYPEYVEAKPELAAFFGVSPDELILTNGTDEAIQVLVNTYVDRGGDVFLLRPSYAMYRFYAEVAGATIREIDYRPSDLAFPLEPLLCILEKARNAAVLIDEAYFEFSGLTALPLIQRCPNLFVSRTFSKVYGMAAMRIGCLFSCPRNIGYLRKAQSPYSVNTLAVLAARAAIQDRAYIENYVAEVLAARDLLRAGLDELGIPYYPSDANFILMRIGPRSIEVRDRLREKGVLVRDRSYDIPGTVRVTVGTREQIGRFLEELKGIWP